MIQVGFGLERIGLATVRWPLFSSLAVLAISLLAAVGIARLDVTSEFTDLFSRDSADYRSYMRMIEAFPGGGGDVYIVISGPGLLKRENLEKIRALHLDLELNDGVAGVLSLFSLRRTPDRTGFPAPLFPDPLPTGGAFEKLLGDAASHPMAKGSLLSQNGDVTLVIVALESGVLKTNFRTVVDDLRAQARQSLNGSGLSVGLTGVPVLRKAIYQAIRNDRVLYNTGGFLVGLFVSFLFFRKLAPTIIAAAAPAAAVFWSFGMIGLMGDELSVIIIIIAPLVMVISFSDAMHLVFGIRRGLEEGLDKRAAVRRAITTVGPACVLTSLTTCIALSSLTFSQSASVRDFGFYGAIAALIAFLAVMLLVPLLSIALLRDGRTGTGEAPALLHSGAISRLYGISGWLADFIAPRALLISIGAVVLLVVAGAGQWQLQPSYRLSHYVPDGTEANTALERLESAFSGSQPVHILISSKAPLDLDSDLVGRAIGEAHRIFVDDPNVHNVWSLDSLRGWLRSPGARMPGRLGDYIGKMPPYLARRLISEDGRSVLITGRIGDVDSRVGREILAGIDAKLARLAARMPELSFALTGLSTISARQTDSLINGLLYSLFGAIVMVVIMIAIAFRSIRLALLSILPNVLPIVIAGATLYVTGTGLQIAACVAMIVAFGLAVDDTIHFLHRYRFERERTGDVADAVAQTVRRIGPVLMLTTVVLVLGIGVTLFSDVPSNRLFGQLSGVILVSALVADVVFLPALIQAVGRIRTRLAATVARHAMKQNRRS